MPDRPGYRAKWGLVMPSGTTVCETGLHRAVPAGITIDTASVWDARRDAGFDDRIGGVGMLLRDH